MDEVIYRYFPEATHTQRKQFSQLEPLYREWNSKINVVSRKDIDKIYIHHVLHSLTIAKIISFAKNTHIIDVGTGGGFPGIPLAILFPNCKFTLIDSIGKKVLVANEVISNLGLENATALKCRAEEVNTKFDFAVTRAVAPMPTIKQWIRKAVMPGGFNALPNGIIALKGGDLQEELAPLGRDLKKWKITNFFQEEYFEEKFVIYLPIY